MFRGEKQPKHLTVWTNIFAGNVLAQFGQDPNKNSVREVTDG